MNRPMSLLMLYTCSGVNSLVLGSFPDSMSACMYLSVPSIVNDIVEVAKVKVCSLGLAAEERRSVDEFFPQLRPLRPCRSSFSIVRFFELPCCLLVTACLVTW